MKRNHILTFENYQSGKISLPVDYWKSADVDVKVNTSGDKTTGFSQLGKDFTEKFGMEKSRRIIKFFDRFFDGLKEVESPGHLGYTFYYKDNNGMKETYIAQNSNKGDLSCRWDGFWSILENEIGLEYSDIQYVVKAVMEQHLKQGTGLTPSSSSVSSPSIGLHSEREVGTANVCRSFRGRRWDDLLSESRGFTKQNKTVLNEDNHQNPEGLNVYPRTDEDNRKLSEWLPNSKYHAEWNRVEGFWFFPEKEESQDDLEMELEKEFLKLDINVQYEGVWN